MACNLNFNQCNTGRQYPTPISNCTSRLINLLNSNNLSVVNPVVDTAFVLTSIFAQTVGANAIVGSTISFARGNTITLVPNNSFAVSEGQYLLSYVVTGTIPAGGVFSFGVYQNETLLANSVATVTGTAGASVSVTNSVIIDSTEISGYISLRSLIAQSQNVTGGNITLQKL